MKKWKVNDWNLLFGRWRVTAVEVNEFKQNEIDKGEWYCRLWWERNSDKSKKKTVRWSFENQIEACGNGPNQN